MGICIDKLSHECGTRQGLQVFADPESGKVTGYCFSCSTFVPNPYGEPVSVDEVELPKPKSKKQIRKEIEEVQTYQVLSLPERKLKARELEEWGVRVSVRESDGKTPEAVYFPTEKDGQLTGYYVKTLGENSFTFSLGDTKDADPFGWSEALKSGAYRLIITEGYEDAISVKKMYDMYSKPDDQYRPAIVSLPNGVNSTKVLSRLSKRIKDTFREVVLCYDDDKAGHSAVEKTRLILPNALSVTLPYKDANDCLINGATKAAYNALCFNAAKPKNTRLLNSKDVWGLGREPTPYGELTWPYPTMQKLLRGIRYGETIYIGAGVKMGKSELLDCLVAHFIREHKIKVMVAKPEQGLKESIKKIASKIAGYNFVDPDTEFDYGLYDEAGRVVDDKVYFLNMYQHIGWESLKLDILEAAHAGVKAVFIDPITNLTAGVPSGEANTLLQEISQDLAAMALDLGIVIFIFCHLKAHDGNISKEVRLKKYRNGEYYKLGNCAHEYGGDILSNQFYGSRAMMQKCHLMIGLAGNKDEELPEEIQRMRWLCINEDRQFGNSSSVPLIWNPKTTLYKEVM